MKKILVLGLGTGFIVGTLREHRWAKKIITEKNWKIDKLQNGQHLLLEWIKLHGKIDLIDAYFKWCGVSSIAVYGNGQVGKCFIKELEHTNVKVRYIIDKNAEYMNSEIPILSLEKDLPKVDAIVMAMMDQCDSIKKEIEKKCDYPVMSIEDVIYGSHMY